MICRNIFWPLPQGTEPLRCLMPHLLAVRIRSTPVGYLYTLAAFPIHERKGSRLKFSRKCINYGIAFFRERRSLRLPCVVIFQYTRLSHDTNGEALRRGGRGSSNQDTIVMEGMINCRWTEAKYCEFVRADVSHSRAHPDLLLYTSIKNSIPHPAL